MTRACSGPMQAATVAAMPHALISQNTLLACVIRRISSGGIRVNVQIVSLMNA